MNMQKIIYKDKIPAFTYIEVLVSLIIISLIAGLLYFSYFVSIRSLRKSENDLKIQILRLDVDTKIRDSAEEFIIPFWEKHINLTFSESQISFSWGDSPNNKRVLDFPSNVRIKNCDFLYSSSDIPQGLSVTYEINNQEFLTKALFASYFYGEKEC